MSIESQIRHTKRNKEKLNFQGNFALAHYFMFFFPSPLQILSVKICKTNLANDLVSPLTLK